jgi:hypothetical protein
MWEAYIERSKYRLVRAKTGDPILKSKKGSSGKALSSNTSTEKKQLVRGKMINLEDRD